MKLFAFGLGYSAREFAKEYPNSHVIGTCQTADKCKALNALGGNITAINFDDAVAVAAGVGNADIIVISIPPKLAENDTPIEHRIENLIEPTLDNYGALIQSHPEKHYCYLSTTGVYGNHDGAWVAEDTAPIPTQPRSQIRLCAEEIWQEHAPNLSILRLAGIYGPTRNAVLNLQNGKTMRALVKYHDNNEKQVFSHIHTKDIARAIKFCAKNKQFGIYNLCDDNPCPPDEVMRYAAKLLKITAPPLVNFDDADDMSPMARSFYADFKRVSNQKISDAGFEFYYKDWRDALNDIRNDIVPVAE